MPGEEELIQQRREKLSRLRARGIDPYPPRVARTHTSADAIAAYERWGSEGSAGEPPHVTIAGRITSMRNMGKMAFIDTRDGTARIQSLLRFGVKLKTSESQSVPRSDVLIIVGNLVANEVVHVLHERLRLAGLRHWTKRIGNDFEPDYDALSRVKAQRFHFVLLLGSEISLQWANSIHDYFAQPESYRRLNGGGPQFLYVWSAAEQFRHPALRAEMRWLGEALYKDIDRIVEHVQDEPIGLHDNFAVQVVPLLTPS